jgi:predicted outer membrane protein
MNSILKTSVLPAAVCLAAASAMAQSTGKPTDPQIADIAYTAGQIDIEQAIDALKRTHTQAGGPVLRRRDDPGQHGSE